MATGDTTQRESDCISPSDDSSPSSDSLEITPGTIVWLTGLPSSGKTTIARALFYRMINTGYKPVWWDGDVVRGGLGKDLGFSKEDRNEAVRRVAWLARECAGQGHVVIVSMVSPYVEARVRAREEARGAGCGFVEVWVDCPIWLCLKRDVKGLYKKHTPDMTGVDDPYQPPGYAEVVCDTYLETLEESVEKVWKGVMGNV